MIRNLHIENIALISRLDIEFENGLIVLSGETGAGKSIIIDSLAFVLGERADKTLIKYGQESAFVEVAFNIEQNSKTWQIMAELGLETDTTVVINRTLTLSGKNESRVNSRICSAAVLRSITATLVDIFGQSQHLNLLKVDNHIKVLDDYRQDGELKNQLKKLYSDYRELKKQLSAFGGSDAERERLLDILKFQIDEITAAKLSETEENELIEIRSKVMNVEKIVSSVTAALDSLSTSGVMSRLAEAKNSLLSVAAYDKDISSLAERLSAVQIETDDIFSSLDKILREADYNPAQIDRMEERLEKIKNIKKKYGGTVADALKFLEKASAQYDNLVNATDIISKLNAKIEAVVSQMYELALKLSSERKTTAKRFEKEIETQLKDLGMSGTTFEVRFNDIPTFDEYKNSVSSDGFDKVEFLLSANKGEPLKPLAKIISGGEMSRFMLAIKNITAHIEQIPTMVFDEIDIGISGNMAQMVAIKLANVSRDYQCIVITHLPQIAAMGDSNMLIVKGVYGERTETRLTVLDKKGKNDEITRLIGGSNIGEYGGLHAKEMIDWADNIKTTIKNN